MADESRIRRPSSDELSRLSDELPLHNEAYARAVRAIHALLGQDPQNLRIPEFSLGGSVNFEMLLADASGPPFRRNGKGFAIPINAAAQLGVGNLLRFQNVYGVSKDTPLFAIAVVDAVVYGGGASPLVLATRSCLNQAGLAGRLAIDLESPPITDKLIQPTKPALTGLLTSPADGSDSVLPPVVGVSVVGQIPQGSIGPVPVGVPVYPGEEFLAFQSVVNVAMVLTIQGHLWIFGTQGPPTA